MSGRALWGKAFLLGPEEYITVPEKAATWLTQTHFVHYRGDDLSRAISIAKFGKPLKHHDFNKSNETEILHAPFAFHGQFTTALQYDFNKSIETEILPAPFHAQFTATLEHDFNKSSEKKVRVYRVQEIPATEHPPLLFGCKNEKVAFAREEWDGFLVFVEDSSSFMERLTEQLSSTHMLLSSEKCLLDDFQAFINHQGLLYHIDLDRCFDRIDTDGTLFSNHPHHVHVEHLIADLGNCFEEFRLHAMATFGLSDRA